MVALLAVQTLDQGRDIRCLPDGGARAEFYGFGETPRAAAFPPRALADGEDFQNLGQTEKAVSGG